MIAGGGGLGGDLVYAQRNFESDAVFAILIVMLIVGYTLDHGVLLFRRAAVSPPPPALARWGLARSRKALTLSSLLSQTVLERAPPATERKSKGSRQRSFPSWIG
jgi:hypothetical protein